MHTLILIKMYKPVSINRIFHKRIKYKYTTKKRRLVWREKKQLKRLEKKE